VDCLNVIAPAKEIRLRKSYVPWFDAELVKLSTIRDKLHKKAMKSQLKKDSTDFSLFVSARNRFRAVFKAKMTSNYEEKSDFIKKRSSENTEFFEICDSNKKICINRTSSVNKN
jgi:hypothetical protein